MRILVTGASGFAGTHLLSELARIGEHEVTACTYGEIDQMPERLRRLAARWISLDITSDQSVGSVVQAARPAQVYHLAGQASVGESFRSPRETWDVNATGTLRLMESLREEGLTGSRVLLISSAEVYGSVPETEQPITEARPLRPITPYGASKAAAEMVGLQTALSGELEVVTARSFNHIGPGQDERFVLPGFARQLARISQGMEEPVVRVGNLNLWRDFLDVRDAVRAYVQLMTRGAVGGVYNICSGVTVSLEAVVRRLVELSGTGARLVVDEDRVRPVDIPALKGSPARLRALGWNPEVPLDRTLGDLLREAGVPSVGDG